MLVQTTEPAGYYESFWTLWLLNEATAVSHNTSCNQQSLITVEHVI